MNSEHFSTKNLDRRQFIRQAGCAAASAALLAESLPVFGQDATPVVAVALVGCAHIHTPDFARRLKARGKEVKVKYLWDHEKSRAEKYAKSLGGGEVVEDVKTIWADPEVKAVVICSETTRHPELVLAAAAAGKHIYAEKPLGVTAQESRVMAAAIEKAKVLFNTGYFMRSEKENLFLKEQVDKGSFGKITHVRGSNCHEGSLGGWFDTDYRWMADPKIAGVGAFGDLGTHSLDILMWMFGDVESITADVKVVTGRYGDCDESGEALMKFKNGITATLAAGWVDVANPVTILISGTEGHAVKVNNNLFFKSKHVEGADGNRPWTKLPEARSHAFEQFVDAVVGKPGATLVTPGEAAARVSVMEAAYKGARNRTWVAPA